MRIKAYCEDEKNKLRDRLGRCAWELDREEWVLAAVEKGPKAVPWISTWSGYCGWVEENDERG